MASLFFEDFHVNQAVLSRGRTVTEGDIVTFAGVSGDHIELHTNVEYAALSAFGQRIAHGALVFSISTGLIAQANLINDTVIAFYGVDRLRFTRPTFIGDTLRVKMGVTELEDKGEKGGLVSMEVQVVNQREELVCIYVSRLLMQKRSSTA